jgi:hypothetical protein
VVNGGLREEVKGGDEVPIAGIGTVVFFVSLGMMLFAVAPVIAQPVEVRVNAPEYVEERGIFDVTIDIIEVNDLNAAQFDLSFDPRIVEVSAVKNGKISKGDIPIILWVLNSDKDTVRVVASLEIGESESGSGYLAEIEFEIKGEEGDMSVLDISMGALYEPMDLDLGAKQGLFSIGEKFRVELNNGEISDELKRIFKDNEYPLEKPTVRVIQEDESWEIIDDKVVYAVKAVKDKLIIKDTGGIPAKWYGTEIIIGGEEDEEEGCEEENGEAVTQGSPDIIAWQPDEAVVSSAVGGSRTFNISIDQIADIRWQINGTEVQTNESTREAIYKNTSAVIGTWNVSAIATNTTTGLVDMHTWIWCVTLTATGTPAPTPTPEVTSAPEAETEGTPMLTPTLTPGVTPTPKTSKPAPKQEEPGFEAILAIAVMPVVAYILLWRRR